MTGGNMLVGHDGDDDDDERGTCLGKYSKGTLFIFEGVADVLFSQAIPIRYY